MSSAPASSKPGSAPSVVPPALGAVSWHRYVVFFGIAIVGCAIDLASKAYIFSWPPGRGGQGEWWLWEGYVGIQTTVNTGALFGLGRGFSSLFAAVSVVAIVGVIYWLFVRRAAHDSLLTVALGSISGGILGNLYDRLGLWHTAEVREEFHYGVRDWILLRYGEFTWPNFNIADCLLVGGVAVLSFHLIFRSPKNDREDEKSKRTGEKSKGAEDKSATDA